MNDEKRLFRSRDAVFGGVCAGMADYFEVDAVIARIIAVVLAILSHGLLVVAYLALWVVLPKEPETFQPYNVRPDQVRSETYGAKGGAAASPDVSPDDPSRSEDDGLSRGAVAAIAVGLGALTLLLLLFANLFIKGVEWWQFWPLTLLIAGLALIVLPAHRRDRAAVRLSAGAMILIAGAVLLVMSLGMCDWLTLRFAVERFWPFLLAAAGFFIAGCVRYNPALLVAAAVSFGAVCFLALTQLWVPGTLESLSLDTPFAHKRLFVLMQGVCLPLS